MKGNNFSLVLAVIIALIIPAALLAVDKPNDEYCPGVIYIKFESEQSFRHTAGLLTGISELDQILLQNGITQRKPTFPERKSLDPRGLNRIFRFHLDEKTDIPALVKKISSIPGIEYATPNYIRKIHGQPVDFKSGFVYPEGVPNDPYYSLQWALPAISAPSAWDVSTGNPYVVIAIVDNGIDLDHPDLEDNIWTNPGETPNNNIDDDNNGFVDDYYGWDFTGDDNDPNPDLTAGDEYHGTHVAGIAGAVMNNGRGIAGIAPDCALMSVKAGSGNSIYNGAEAIIYAVDNGADVINLSWGGYLSNPVEEDAVATALLYGGTIVAAAGNDNTDDIHYPSAYEGVLSVASINPDNKKSSFSNYGIEVDLSAPGSYIYSTIVTSGGQPGYAYLQGTSMSSPLVAGVAALVLDANPGWHYQKVAIKLVNSCDDIDALNPGYEGLLGSGKINAFHAVGDLMPGLKISSVTVSDENFGDGDGIPEPDETLEIDLAVENKFQDAFDVSGILSTASQHAAVMQSEAEFGNIPEGGSAFNDQPFIVQLGAVSEGEKIIFELNLHTQAGFDIGINLEIVALPPYATHSAGNVMCTVTNFGAIGFQNYPYQIGNYEHIGEGFRYPLNGVNALYHGSMVLGLNQSRVCAAIYRENIPPYDFEWQYDQFISFHQPGEIADQETNSEYYDHNVFLPPNTSITVQQNTYAYSAAAVEDFIIIEYRYENVSGATFDNLYSGLFMDWDVGNYADNSVGYNASYKAGYMFQGDSYYYGLAVLSDNVAAHSAINNSTYTYGIGLTDSYLYKFLSGELNIPGGSGSDFSQMISVGPFSLSPGEEKSVYYAILAADNLYDFLNNVLAADSVYLADFVLDSETALELPLELSLSLPSPNPFNQTVNFFLELNRQAQVKVSIFDLLGREAGSIFDGTLTPGIRQFHWNAANLASGTYFLRASAGTASEVKKLILLK